ncbi:MAG TPA: protein kinase [Pirellulaceae bacterium]|nr:protein kinase [Pirellulaceae bacterium]
MLNDRQAVELLSRSMRGEASAVDLAKLSTHLERSPETRAFAEWTRRIEDSVAEAAVRIEAGDESLAPDLADDARKRLKDSIRAALGGTNPSSLVPAPETAVSSAVGGFARTLAAGDQDAAEVLDGRRMASRFTLLRKLGEGGLGTVWLARDERLRRNVALKEMSTSAALSPAAWQRFRREAEITGSLEHPNVVPIYQSGVDPDSGLPFYVMRFLGKKTLAAAIVEYHQRRLAGQRNAVEFHRLLTAFLGVCQAVAYAHSRHVIHRDLKPENVALDHFGQVLVLDWGLAKHLEDADPTGGNEASADAGEGARTLAGEIVGTPLYMAPEQAAGRLDEIDQRTDVYGLGAILFAILTGQAPHEKSAANGRGTTARVEQLLDAISKHDPPRPRTIDSDIPRELDEICHRAMSRLRSLRQESAEELAEQVQSWMAGQHEKVRRYDNLRMEGRDLRAGLAAALRSLGTNSRFMAGLPPIQGLVGVDLGRPGEDRNVWRERLSSIFVGLMQANSDFSAVSFARLDSTYRELVRVERRGADGTCRAVPLSRLGSSPSCPFLERVVDLKPGESLGTLMSRGPGSSREISSSVLCAATPVFDAVTEEPFGAVVVEADFPSLVDRIHQERIRTSRSVTVADREARILFHAGPDDPRRASGECCDEVEEACPKIMQGLAKQDELVDVVNQEWYATRLELEAGGDFLALVLQAGER